MIYKAPKSEWTESGLKDFIILSHHWNYFGSLEVWNFTTQYAQSK